MNCIIIFYHHEHTGWYPKNTVGAPAVEAFGRSFYAESVFQLCLFISLLEVQFTHLQHLVMWYFVLIGVNVRTYLAEWEALWRLKLGRCPAHEMRTLLVVEPRIPSRRRRRRLLGESFLFQPDHLGFGGARGVANLQSIKQVISWSKYI